jgi:putative flippase GtrA
VKLLLSLYYQLDHLVRELMKFGVVGAFAYVIDVGSFNLLRYAGPGLLEDKPLTAKTISVVLAATFAYFGNRHWTFRHRDRSGLRREYPLFFLLNAVGLAIALTCLFISHYMLGFQSALADNISANGVGLALGTTFRFWSYRKWVFPEIADEELAAEAADLQRTRPDAAEPPAEPAASASPR